jgi:tetratricopeptide (TPR) repeat protein
MELKPLNKHAIGSVMEKANHYRLLNDPENAESICRDVLQHDPNHQPALITLVLALADQFITGPCDLKEARSFLAKLDNEYNRIYYGGLICERAARAMLSRSNPGTNYAAYDLFREALEHYGKAEALSSEDNDDAVLRWNACVRTIKKKKLERRPEDNYVPYGD